MVFVVFHEKDRNFSRLFAKHIGASVVDKSVGEGAST